MLNLYSRDGSSDSGDVDDYEDTTGINFPGPQSYARDSSGPGEQGTGGVVNNDDDDIEYVDVADADESYDDDYEEVSVSQGDYDEEQRNDGGQEFYVEPSYQQDYHQEQYQNDVQYHEHQPFEQFDPLAESKGGTFTGPSNEEEAFFNQRISATREEPAALYTIPEEKEKAYELDGQSIAKDEEEGSFYARELRTERKQKRLLCFQAILLWMIVMILAALVIVFATRSSSTENRSLPVVTPAPTTMSPLTESPSEIFIPTQAPTLTQTRTEVSESSIPTEPVSTLLPTSLDFTSAPVTMDPSRVPPGCFETGEELKEAVDRYFLGDPGDQLQAMYGLPIGTWCVQLVTDFNSLFSAVRNPAAATFNDDISQWDMSSALDMGSMFEGAAQFNINLSRWNIQNNRNLTRTFALATSFNGDVKSWNTGSVVEMREAFSGASSFSQDLCTWSTSFKGRTVDSNEVFLGTQCPHANSFVHIGAQVPGPLCYSCDRVFDIVCPLLPNCTVLYGEESPQSQSLNWLRQNPNTELISRSKAIQRYIMTTLYYSTDGANWNRDDNWLTVLDECFWFGAECTDNREIVSLQIPDNGLYGELPLDLSLMTSLRSINLESNTLVGTIPTELGQMSALTSLQLQGNYFIGTIPVEFAALSNLQLLRLDGNSLSGDLPKGLCDLATAENPMSVYLTCEDVTAECSDSVICCSLDDEVC